MFSISRKYLLFGFDHLFNNFILSVLRENSIGVKYFFSSSSSDLRFPIISEFFNSSVGDQFPLFFIFLYIGNEPQQIREWFPNRSLLFLPLPLDKIHKSKFSIFPSKNFLNTEILFESDDIIVFHLVLFLIYIKGALSTLNVKNIKVTKKSLIMILVDCVGPIDPKSKTHTCEYKWYV